MGSVGGAGRVVGVTGGAGRLGERVVEALAERGWRVRALAHRRDVPSAHESVRGDLASGDGLDALAAGADVLVHLAATTHARSEAAYRRVNVGGTANLVAAAVEAGVGRFVHVSSAAISRAGGAYSRSKADGEDIVRLSPLEWVVLRPSVLIGAGAPKDLDDMLRRAKAGRPLLVVGDGRHEVRPVLVGEIAAAIAEGAAAPAAAGQVYTLGGDAVTMRAFAAACRDLLGGRSAIVGVPVPLIRLASVVARFAPLPLYPDQLARLEAPRPEPTPAAATDLGFRPRPTLEALRELAEAL